MLQGLFGSRSAAQILLFLFVNEKCYGAQIQSLLETPLTPIQKTLQRLQKEHILISHYEGKLHIYEFNPNYPLRNELEMLLKKAYAQLPSQEKKHYCFIHKPRLAFQEEIHREKDKKTELLAFWNILTKIKNLSFSVKSRQGQEQSTKIGKAEVQVIAPEPFILIFQEKGYWFKDQIPETSFNNSFRWTLDLQTSLITLEHLRYGLTHPVFLFHLTPTKPFMLEAVDSHLCAEDSYLGSILWNPSYIDFHWRIIGPLKNDDLTYHYN